MRRAPIRLVLVATVAALTATLGQGPAGAVEPDPIVPNLVPPPPPNPAEQRKHCTRAAGTGDSPTAIRALEDMNFRSVWPFTRGAGQTVAVIDTGVNPHPRLPDLVPGGDFVDLGGNGLTDCDAHGTLVAGLIAGRDAPGSGFAGGAPDSRIISIRQSSGAYSPKGSQDAVDNAGNTVGGYGDVTTMAAAIRKAADMGATVINISEVACRSAAQGIGDADRFVGSAVQYAVDVKDAVVVAAAGNVGEGSICQQQNPHTNPVDPAASPWDRVYTIATPAWYDDYVLTVGAVDSSGAAAGFTLAGPWVDVAAPGDGLVSLDPDSPGLTNTTYDFHGNARPVSGTSFAAPLVAATAALVRAHRPELNAREVMDRIKATAHGAGEARSPLVGYGIVNPLAAVTADIPPAALSVEHHRSVAVDALPAPEEPDRRPRNTALAGVGILDAVFTLGVLASFPLRRWRRGAPDGE